MENKLIRETAKTRKIYLWEIAEEIGIAEATFIRRMRRELPEDQQEKILAIIDRLAKEKEGVA